MAKDKQQSLSEAVELLNESIEVISKLKLPEGSQSSARRLLVKLRRARDMLEAESKAPEKGYGWVATVVLKTVEWIGEILINNIPYILRSLLSEHEYREWDLDLRSNTTAFGRA